MNETSAHASFGEIVCPEFYITEWTRNGESRTKAAGEFPLAADDGVCRLVKSEKDEFDATWLVCRCGIRFRQLDGRVVSVRR